MDEAVKMSMLPDQGERFFSIAQIDIDIHYTDSGDRFNSIEDGKTGIDSIVHGYHIIPGANEIHNGVTSYISTATRDKYSWFIHRFALPFIMNQQADSGNSSPDWKANIMGLPMPAGPWKQSSGSPSLRKSGSDYIRTIKCLSDERNRPHRQTF